MGPYSLLRHIFVEIYTCIKRSFFLQIQVLQSLIKVLFLYLKKRGHLVLDTRTMHRIQTQGEVDIGYSTCGRQAEGTVCMVTVGIVTQIYIYIIMTLISLNREKYFLSQYA